MPVDGPANARVSTVRQSSMGTYVHLHVCFQCTDNAPVAALARSYLEMSGASFGYEGEIFLKDLTERSGRNWGPKGGLCLWGIIGNGTRPKEFVYPLAKFWLGLLTLKDGEP